MKIVISDGHDAFYNLALEEYLAQGIEKDGIILYLWQNGKAVIIGRNQNPYMECDFEYAKGNGISIARRMSGGGAVYHDLGNLNYTAIFKNELYSRKAASNFLLKSLLDIGIDAKITGRNDIELNGKKISGTAYYQGNHFAYQHGCILVKADLDTIGKVLKPDDGKVTSKGIPSVRARVANISDFNPDISIKKLESSLVKNAEVLLEDTLLIPSECARTDVQRIDPMGLSDGGYKEIVKKYLSDDWNLQKKIDMRYALHNRFGWGDCTVLFESDCNIIEDAYIFSDSLDTDVFLAISSALKGVPFKRGKILKKLELLKESALAEQEKIIISDIIGMLIKELNIHD